MKLPIAILAGIFAIIGNIPYLRDIIKKRIQPHPYTWLVWTIVSCIIFFGQIAKGAGVGAIGSGAAEIFTVIIFIFSLRYGFKKIRAIDTVFLIVALLGLIPWYLTHDPTISVIIAVAIDLCAFAPTVRKTWLDTRTETPMLFGMNVLRHILMLFSLQAYNIATTLHSIVMIIMNTGMTIIILFKKNMDPESSSG